LKEQYLIYYMLGYSYSFLHTKMRIKSLKRSFIMKKQREIKPKYPFFARKKIYTTPELKIHIRDDLIVGSIFNLPLDKAIKDYANKIILTEYEREIIYIAVKEGFYKEKNEFIEKVLQDYKKEIKAIEKKNNDCLRANKYSAPSAVKTKIKKPVKEKPIKEEQNIATVNKKVDSTLTINTEAKKIVTKPVNEMVKNTSVSKLKENPLDIYDHFVKNKLSSYDALLKNYKTIFTRDFFTAYTDRLKKEKDYRTLRMPEMCFSPDLSSPMQMKDMEELIRNTEYKIDNSYELTEMAYADIEREIDEEEFMLRALDFPTQLDSLMTVNPFIDIADLIIPFINNTAANIDGDIAGEIKNTLWEEMTERYIDDEKELEPAFKIKNTNFWIFRSYSKLLSLEEFLNLDPIQQGLYGARIHSRYLKTMPYEEYRTIQKKSGFLMLDSAAFIKGVMTNSFEEMALDRLAVVQRGNPKYDVKEENRFRDVLMQRVDFLKRRRRSKMRWLENIVINELKKIKGVSNILQEETVK